MEKQPIEFTVVLIAAGQSSRMQPLSNKIFFRYLGKTILEHQINNLIDLGLNNFIIVGNEKNIDQIKKICNVENYSKVRISYSVQKDLKAGIKGAILSVEKIIDKSKALFLISSNDFVEKNIFKKVLNQSKNSDSDIYIVGKIVENYFPGGYLKVSHKNQIIEIVEKPKQGKEPSNMINLVIQLFKNPTELFEAENKFSNQNDDAHELALDYLFTKKKAELVKYNGFWQTLKYPWNHLQLMDYFLKNLKEPFIHSETEISQNVSLKGLYYIDKGVKIYDFACLNGPVYLGQNSIVGNHTLIRNSIIDNNCVIGHCTEISHSLIQNNCWFHQNYIGDSILDENISFGAGTRTGNLRLDEKNIIVNIKKEKINSNLNKLGSIVGKNVRIGINTSIMPGIKIGQDSFLSAHLNVQKDIANNNFIHNDFSLIQKKNLQKAKKR